MIGKQEQKPLDILPLATSQCVCVCERDRVCVPACLRACLSACPRACVTACVVGAGRLRALGL